MTKKKSLIEVEREYGRRIVIQSLTVWNALAKAVEIDKTIADIVVGAKAPSEAWKILTSIVDGEDSERAKQQKKKKLGELSTDHIESTV